MAVFSRFADLPVELRFLIWEAAIPQSPSVHFFSYPRTPHDVADKAARSCRNRWHSEIPNAKRTINVSENPEIGEPTTRTGTLGRYSSYMASLALLHTCQESRRICLAHANSSSTVSAEPCDVFPINLARDIICIQDPSSRLPWKGLPSLRLFPELSPSRIAMERPRHLNCKIKVSRRSRQYIAQCGCARNWGFWDPGYLSKDGFVASFGFRYVEPGLKVIYLLDYAIKPKSAIAPDTIGTGGQELRRPCGSEQNGSVSPAVKLSGCISKHNGKFHGHGVIFYALPAITKEISSEWEIPQKARKFRDSVCGHLYAIYGYNVVRDSRKMKEGETNRIAVEFLACVRA